LQRVLAAKSRVEELNPLVFVKTLSSLDALHLPDSAIQAVDLVCLTDMDRDFIVSVLHYFDLAEAVNSEDIS
jgi:molybdopterin/thiamine biosynthesis adenylyltransferase